MSNKAEFRALREACGLTQQNVADAVGVRVTAVKRWERPGWPDPPEDVREYLEIERDRLEQMASYAADKAVELRDETGAERVTLSYYRDQEHYDRAGRDAGPVGYANAAARLAALYLEAEGLEVAFSYPEDRKTGDVETMKYDYDLSDLDKLCDGMGGFIELTATDGRLTASIITNRSGEGLWRKVETPFGPEYRQIMGTCQFGLPTDSSGKVSEGKIRKMLARELNTMRAFDDPSDEM